MADSKESKPVLRRKLAASGRADPAAAAARRGVQTLRALLDGISSPAWLRDEEGALVWVNAAYARAVETDSGAAAIEAIGDMDVAHAASGVDLSFGTAAQARTDAMRELDTALTSDSGTTMTRLSRLQERASSYRRAGKRAMTAGLIGGLSSGISSFNRIRGRR